MPDPAISLDDVQPRTANADDPVARFCKGEIGRQEAMRALGVPYSRLIDLAAARGLPLPLLPDQETDAMASLFEHLWKDAASR